MKLSIIHCLIILSIFQITFDAGKVAKSSTGETVTIRPGSPVRILAPGSPVRILAPGYAEDYIRRRQKYKPVTGTIDTIRADTVIFQSDDHFESLAIPLNKIDKLEIRGKSRGKNMLNGAWIGFLSFAILGSVIGAVSPKEHDMEQGSIVLFYGAILGGAGLILGIGVGAAKPPSDTWREIDPYKLQIGRRDIRGSPAGLTITYYF